MLNKRFFTSLVVGAAALIGTSIPTPALANNNNAALNMMAMQMYMQQQANAQTQAILAQQQAQANYAAAQAAWAANTIPQTQVSYMTPQPVYVQSPQVVYVNHAFHGGYHHEFRR
jgi:hypothetical protein